MLSGLEDLQGVEIFDRAGYRPNLTAVGRVLVDHARFVLASAARFEAVATNTRSGVEPQLTIAVDPLAPTDSLIESLKKLSNIYPALLVSFSNEGLRGALRRFRDGTAALGVCIPTVLDDISAQPISRNRLKAVVAPTHALLKLGRPVKQAGLEQHGQLVLSEPPRARITG
ncbi:LysR substrate-binding domain-containing protein [Rhizobium nepotum]|uniref:LysR substrate-binding domain-containing protein n=1 Tax=Rhizobium nepotum TaxID=1035271 RepID=UPI003CF1DBFB